MANPFTFSPELSEFPSNLSLDGGKTAILCDSNSLQHCWPKIGEDDAFAEAEIIEVDPGEEGKSYEMVTQLWQVLIDHDFDRNDTLICLGGGVITDLGGFIGSTFKRGIRTYHIPTSLLAMVDASIGGKTGINFGGFKNQIGTFNGLIKTFICPEFLSSLPQDELLSGFAEMIKHGVLDSREHLQQLLELNALNPTTIGPLVEYSARFKEKIVEMDFQESGKRQQLNFGHTLGHAIEALQHSRGLPLSHGHCVALGMLAEIELHEDENDEFSFLQESLRQLIIPNYDLAPLKSISTEELLPFLIKDKKNQGDDIMMTHLAGVGKYKGVMPLDPGEIDEALSSIIS